MSVCDALSDPAIVGSMVELPDMTKLPMTDPIFALIDDAKLLGRVAIVVDDEADARYFALSDEERAKLSGVPFAKRSKAHAEAKAAQKAWEPR
jgi:hypothetical protein